MAMAQAHGQVRTSVSDSSASLSSKKTDDDDVVVRLERKSAELPTMARDVAGAPSTTITV